MTNERKIISLLEDTNAKKEFVYTLTEVIRELTENALDSRITDHDSGEEKLIAIGYELSRIRPHIDNIHHMITDLNIEIDKQIDEAIRLTRAQ